MTRRGLLLALAAAAATAGRAGHAHTPYRQWKVYRLRHLMIGTSREEEPTYALGREIVALLEARLPASRARVARARTVARLASLIGTGQIRVLLLSSTRALELDRGRGAFAATGAVSLRTLYRFGEHRLVADAGFPDHHAWSIVDVLTRAGDAVPGAAPPLADASEPPLHPGALAALRGAPRPPAPPPAADPHSH